MVIRFPEHYRSRIREYGFTFNSFVNLAVTNYLRLYQLGRMKEEERRRITRMEERTCARYEYVTVPTCIRLQRIHKEYAELNQLIMSRVVILATEWLIEQLDRGIMTTTMVRVSMDHQKAGQKTRKNTRQRVALLDGENETAI